MNVDNMNATDAMTESLNKALMPFIRIAFELAVRGCHREEMTLREGVVLDVELLPKPPSLFLTAGDFYALADAAGIRIGLDEEDGKAS